MALAPNASPPFALILSKVCARFGSHPWPPFGLSWIEPPLAKRPISPHDQFVSQYKIRNYDSVNAISSWAFIAHRNFRVSFRLRRIQPD